MLIEERHIKILDILNKKQAITVKELVNALNSSEATIRRDLVFLNKTKKLIKVHGGATSINGIHTHIEESIEHKIHINIEEKNKIAKRAISLIGENDLVYIDSGSTTILMADFITKNKSHYVTNSIEIAKKLSKKEINVTLLGGRLRINTQALVGSEALKNISKYNFSIGFFGTNGININEGFTTTDSDEANIKSKAINKCSTSYILADSTKFNKISSITFAEISSCKIITEKLNHHYFRKYTSIEEA